VEYRVRIHRRVVNLIRSWNLPDEIQEEVYLYLNRVLPADLEHNLSRETNPYNGLVCCFCRRDLHVQGREHEFIFHVFFSDDEQFLQVENGSYHRDDGL
jgi:hypothetical protein